MRGYHRIFANAMPAPVKASNCLYAGLHRDRPSSTINLSGSDSRMPRVRRCKAFANPSDEGWPRTISQACLERGTGVDGKDKLLYGHSPSANLLAAMDRHKQAPCTWLIITRTLASFQIILRLSLCHPFPEGRIA